MQKILDIFGIITAGLCGVHCVLMPCLFLVMPFFAHDHGHCSHHTLNVWSIDFICLVLAPVWALYPLLSGYSKHHNMYPVLFFILSFLCLCMGVLILHDNILLHTLCMVVGALGILSAHYYNIVLKPHNCAECH